MNEDILQNTSDKLVKVEKHYGMEIKTQKTKIMRSRKRKHVLKIIVKKQNLEVNKFNELSTIKQMMVGIQKK